MRVLGLCLTNLTVHVNTLQARGHASLGTSRADDLIQMYYSSFLLFILFRSLIPSAAVYSISLSEPLFPNQTLISSSQIFELGFFTPNGSSYQHVGLWYKNFTPSKIVWVANRDRPLPSKDQLASLAIGTDGNLRLLDGAQNMVWSTNVSVKSNGSTAVLLDTGNFLLRDVESGNIVWQSFDHPTDTLLPDMKIGINVKTGEKRDLISWKTDTDPSPGIYSFGITSEIPPQLFIWNGSSPYRRVANGTNREGSFESVKRASQEGEWYKGWEAPTDRCEIYGTCGPFGICDLSVSPICKCLKGFEPKSEGEWKRGNWTSGCRRKKELVCEKDGNTGAPSSTEAKETDYFLKLSQMKLPDDSIYLPYADADAGNCQRQCLNNCSCTAYAYVDTIGCMIWLDELIDVQSFNGSGEDLFLRLASAERGDGEKSNQNEGSMGKLSSASQPFLALSS
ncbi:hypothetical protein CDL15_Pgr000241 [Punica granatum]|uniref:Bulb-type lectin domain-containing protein n=1 Tax=Punica granatum TaxID=22663 RepID=A0A218Y1X1_PUNGR|nr:hypothetical protein CDL15_Pgr000241 [Punica granatum]